MNYTTTSRTVGPPLGSRKLSLHEALGSSKVRRQKQEAVAREDYDRAMELKELEKQLQNQRRHRGILHQFWGEAILG